MKCPFCAEEIKDEALVCKHCGRDLIVMQPILQALREQSGRFDELNAKIEALQTEFRALRPGSIEPAADGEPADIIKTAPNQPQHSASVLAGIGLNIFWSLLLFAVADYIIVQALDLDIRWMLVPSLVIPAILGASTDGLARLPFPLLVAVSLVLGFISLAVMLITAAGGHVNNVLPDTHKEWTSDIGWMISIALSFVTGALARRFLSGYWNAIRQLTSNDEEIDRLLKIGAPLVAALGAIWTGIHGLLQ